MTNIDIDINNYNFNELTKLLNVSNNGFSKRELELEYEKRLELNKEIEDINLKENLENFFKNVYNFLYRHTIDFKYESNNYIENLDSKLNYLIDFNYKSNPNFLNNILATNTINESNISLNPKTYNIIKKQISINSEFRKTILSPWFSDCSNNKDKKESKAPRYVFDSSSSDFTIEFPESIDNVISMELVNTEIPNLINTFSKRKGNYEFIINVWNNGNKEINHIFIPDGVWVVSTFQNYLSTNYFDTNILDSTGALLNKNLRYLKFEILSWSAKPVLRFKTFDEIALFNNSLGNDGNTSTSQQTSLESSYDYLKNMKYSIENVLHEYHCKSTEKQFNIYKDANKNKINFGLTCLGTMGFDIDQVLNNGNPIVIKYTDPKYFYPPISLYKLNFYNGYLLAEKVYGYNGETALYISVNDYVGNQGQQILLLGYDKTVTADNILARVPVKIGPFQSNIYNSLIDYSIKREYYGGVKIRKLNIQILDKYGRIVDLSDYPTNFVFEFTIQYSSERLAIFRNQM